MWPPQWGDASGLPLTWGLRNLLGVKGTESIKPFMEVRTRHFLWSRNICVIKCYQRGVRSRGGEINRRHLGCFQWKNLPKLLRMRTWSLSSWQREPWPSQGNSCCDDSPASGRSDSAVDVGRGTEKIKPGFGGKTTPVPRPRVRKC